MRKFTKKQLRWMVRSHITTMCSTFIALCPGRLLNAEGIGIADDHWHKDREQFKTWNYNDTAELSILLLREQVSDLFQTTISDISKLAPVENKLRHWMQEWVAGTKGVVGEENQLPKTKKLANKYIAEFTA